MDSTMIASEGTPPPIAAGATNLSAPASVAAPVQQASNGGAMPVNGNVPMNPPMGDPVQNFGNGGVVGFFKSLNWVEVGFMILGSAALISTMYYYKVQISRNKLINDRLQKQIDEVKMNVQSSMKKNYKEIV